MRQLLIIALSLLFLLPCLEIQACKTDEIIAVSSEEPQIDDLDPVVYYDKTENGIRTIKATPCSGVCSRDITIAIDTKTDTVKSMRIVGGCPGNALGISKLCTGMKVDDIIKALAGTRCGGKPTSCPDQIARILEGTR